MMYDFGEGEVPAKKHPNGGGWVADTAKVDASAYVGPDAKVFGNALVYVNAQVFDAAKVFGDAWVSGKAQVFGDAEVFDTAEVSGDARVYGNAKVFGDARVYGIAEVYGDARVYTGTHVTGDNNIVIKEVNKMKYENKWVLNEGQDIPENADTLKSDDGSVVAYRLPVRGIKVGDEVYVKNSHGVWSTHSRTVLYIHQKDERKYYVIAYKGDIPVSKLEFELKCASV